ncbi:MAG: UDP-N-acetylmuramoyl-L-alanine--D-glutamate ligase [Puniceicoccales bacterium]|nr:UDP-N-acetylmuramoyl-L-alanine--D-glutamate ligase [Puniceicoccales bacterium]
MNIPKNIAPLLSRPVAVLGTGVSGTAASCLLERIGATPALYDEKGGNNAATAFGAAEAGRHRLVVYSPGFAQNHPWLLAARRTGALCMGELDFASLFWTAPAIAVTGTNGKTTLTEFLVFAHKRNGRESIATGNNGFPFSRIPGLAGNRTPLPVCEVSSFQAEDLRHFAPSALLWTNFDEDHLDRHRDLETYFRAKHKLVDRLATRRLIVGESVVAFARKLGLALPSFTEVASRAGVADRVPQGCVFSTFPQMENYALARCYWLAEGFSEHTLEDAARLFTPVRHRLAEVAQIDGVTYWNDSKGTNFHAVMAALEAMPRTAATHWIGGGQGKGGDLGAFARRLSKRVKSACLIGETAPELHGIFLENGVPSAIFKNLPDAVHGAWRAASAGESVLFSPGFASFDMFASYAERGLVFEQTVQALKNAAPNAK